MSSTAPVYLIELMDPHLGTIERVDVTAFLENGIATVHKHLAEFREEIEIEVTIDRKSGELAGIVFYSEEEQPISVIRPFYLHRDELECASQEIIAMSQMPLPKLESKLNNFFKKGK